jgi:hypothetical protein
MRHAFLWLGLLGSALSLGWTMELRKGAPALTVPGRSLANRPVANVAPVSADPTDYRVSMILARPVFEPTRRPPVSVSPTTGGDADAIPRLAGIIITPTQRSAIFMTSSKAKAQVLTQGAHLGPLVIQSIGATSVLVVGPKGPQFLSPRYDLDPHPDAVPETLPSMPPFVLKAPQTAAPASAAPPFANIPGLTGRPLGLAANPDQPDASNGSPP